VLLVHCPNVKLCKSAERAGQPARRDPVRAEIFSEALPTNVPVAAGVILCDFLGHPKRSL